MSHEVRSLHVFSLHEDTHDHADVCTAHGTAVERSHSVRATRVSRVRVIVRHCLGLGLGLG